MACGVINSNVMSTSTCPQVYLVVGGYLTASTELLTEGAAAWTFAGPVPLASWISVVSIHNNVISTGGRVLTVSSNQLIKLDCGSNFVYQVSSKLIELQVSNSR